MHYLAECNVFSVEHAAVSRRRPFITRSYERRALSRTHTHRHTLVEITCQLCPSYFFFFFFFCPLIFEVVSHNSSPGLARDPISRQLRERQLITRTHRVITKVALLCVAHLQTPRGQDACVFVPFDRGIWPKSMGNSLSRVGRTDFINPGHSLFPRKRLCQPFRP